MNITLNNTTAGIFCGFLPCLIGVVILILLTRQSRVNFAARVFKGIGSELDQDKTAKVAHNLKWYAITATILMGGLFFMILCVIAYLISPSSFGFIPTGYISLFVIVTLLMGLIGCAFLMFAFNRLIGSSSKKK